MKAIMTWLHMVICILATVAFFTMAGSPHISKDQFIIVLVVYTYMILILIALLKDNFYY
jgi:Ca2+/Na+ antiporter